MPPQSATPAAICVVSIEFVYVFLPINAYSYLIVFLIDAFVRKLRCPRNLLHLHLFASFILRAVVVLLRSSLLASATSITPAPSHTPTELSTVEVSLIQFVQSNDVVGIPCTVHI